MEREKLLLLIGGNYPAIIYLDGSSRIKAKKVMDVGQKWLYYFLDDEVGIKCCEIEKVSKVTWTESIDRVIEKDG